MNLTGFSLRLALTLTMAGVLAVSALPARPAADPAKDPLLSLLRTGCDRSMAGFKKLGDAAPYFLGYRVVETRTLKITSSFGAIQENTDHTSRHLNVNVRVGDRKLDSTHFLRDGDKAEVEASTLFPLSGDPASMQMALWQQTNARYRAAVEDLAKIRNEQAVKTAEENSADDFTVEVPRKAYVLAEPIRVDKEEWAQRLRRLSALARAYPFVTGSDVFLSVEGVDRYIVDSEGTTVRTGRNYFRLAINLWTKAEDGMEMRQVENYDSASPAGLPSEEVAAARLRELAENLRKLREAPLVDPYHGPAILSGPAAGVFFHEIFGHRVEGLRQKDESSAQTFARKIGELVLPEYLSVCDDPTLARLSGVDLNGTYDYDDEGVPSQRAVVVEKGVMKGFLLSRSPLKGFPKSNGHGRAEAGLDVVSRQGNLIVESSRSVPYARLREMLIEECRKQNKPFGLVFQSVEGGFTNTGRFRPNAFNVLPLLVYRVYVDGRPDEVVRGVDMIGTPLTMFSKIIGTSSETGIFNGHCGAESGMVPASCCSPALLVAEVEVQKKGKSNDRLPILPSPDQDSNRN